MVKRSVVVSGGIAECLNRALQAWEGVWMPHFRVHVAQLRNRAEAPAAAGQFDGRPPRFGNLREYTTGKAAGQAAGERATRLDKRLPLTCIVGPVRQKLSRRIGPMQFHQLAQVQEIVTYPRSKQVPGPDRAPGRLVRGIPIGWR